MNGEPFASAPNVVGSSSTDRGAAVTAPQPHIPAEESLCPVVSHDWVNAEYKHLVVEASPKALSVTPGQFFNLLCPSPDVGELFFRRPQSVYRIDRERGREKLPVLQRFERFHKVRYSMRFGPKFHTRILL